MPYVFLLLFLAATLALIVGLFNPHVFGKGRTSRINVVLVFGVCAVLSLAMLGVTAPRSNGPSPQAIADQPTKADPMAQALARSEMSPAEYAILCRSVPADIYGQRCMGKRVAWPVLITEVEGRRKVEVRTIDTSAAKFDLQLAKDFKWEGDLKAYGGRKIVFSGKLDAPKGYAHDISNVEILGLPPLTTEEQDLLTAEAQAKAETARKAAAEDQAMTLCQMEFRIRARHPSTVNFGVFDRYHALAWQDGTIVYRAGPTLKNSFGVELRYVLICEVKDGKLAAFEMHEAG